MKTLKTLTKEDRNLLLYLESRAVDYGGRVDLRHMNKEDQVICCEWAAEGFIQWGRVGSEYLDGSVTSIRLGAMWVILTPRAWELAHEERRARNERMWKKRTWETTEELQARG